MPESFLIKCQTEGLQPYLKRDFDADFFPVNVEQSRRNGKNSGGWARSLSKNVGQIS